MLKFTERKLVAPTPTKGTKVAVNLSLEESTRDKIDRLAEAGGFTTRSQFITELVKLVDEQ